MRINRNTQIISVVVLLLIIIGCFTAALKYADVAVVASITTGIIGSILAGFVFTIFSNFLFGEPLNKEQLDTVINELTQKLINEGQIKSIVQGLSDRLVEINRTGIDQISDRDFFDDEFWKSAIQDAGRNPDTTSELILLGRTLDKWTSITFARIFADTVTKILKNGGNIKVLSLKPDGEAADFYAEAAGKNIKILSRNFEEFMEEEIYPKITDREKDRIERRYIDKLQLTFTMFKSDNLLWISPYLSSSDTASNIALTARKGSRLADIIMNDYRQIRVRHSKLVPYNTIRKSNDAGEVQI